MVKNLAYSKAPVEAENPPITLNDTKPKVLVDTFASRGRG